MTRPVDRVLSRLDNPKRSSGCWKARCPAHDDSHASLSVKEYPDGSAGVKCFTGCTTDQVLSAMGLERRHLFPDQSAPTGPVRRVHVYEDDNRRPFARKTVVKYPDGRKDGWWEHSEDGGKTWERGEGDKRLLYRYPEVLDAIRDGKPVYLNEGERGADTCCLMGLCGTSHGHGTSFETGYADQLEGARVVVVVDRDKASEDWARYNVGPVLRKTARAVTFVQSATAREHDDAHDHFVAGKRADDFLKRVDLSGVPTLAPTTLNGTFQPVVQRYLWAPYLPEGKMVLLDADGGVGKSSLALAIAASLSQGVLPNGDGRRDPVKTLYLHQGEDPTEELETVYRACGGVPGMIGYVETLDCLDARGCAMLEATIRDGGFGLVVLDALFYFLQGLMRDSHQAFDVMPTMKRIAQIYQRTSATAIHIRHTGKSVVGRAVSDLGLGSVQFRNSHRGQLVARFHPDVKGLVIVQDLKGSILTDRGESFAYRRVGNALEWVMDFEDPYAGRVDVQSARAWLVDLLARGPQESDRVRELAIGAKVSWKAVRTLKGVAVKRRIGGIGGEGRWLWSLDPGVDPFEDAESHKETVGAGWWQDK